MAMVEAASTLGSFSARRIVGEGGSGVVYEIDGDDGTSVALKVLRTELAASDRERDRFLREAKRMQRLSHPSLVPLLTAGVLPDGRPYLTMPLLHGETIIKRVRRTGAMPMGEALHLFDTITGAVEALHAGGLVHRDIKPENVIIEADASGGSRAVLLDFGIAADLDGDPTTTTIEGRLRGTPAYMAPERFFGAAATVRSDVYELTVLLYVMLTGKLPWSSEASASDRLDPADPRLARPEIPGALSAAMLRALSTRPEMRPESAASLAEIVTRAANEGPDPEPARFTTDIDVRAMPVTLPPPPVQQHTVHLQTTPPRGAPGLPARDRTAQLEIQSTPSPLTRTTPPAKRGLRVGLSLVAVVALAASGVLVWARSSTHAVTRDPSHGPVAATAQPAEPEPHASQVTPSPSSTSMTLSLNDGPDAGATKPNARRSTRRHGGPQVEPASHAPSASPVAATSAPPAPSVSARRREEWFEDRK
jgi:serine/threonine protein kinase